MPVRTRVEVSQQVGRPNHVPVRRPQREGCDRRRSDAVGLHGHVHGLAVQRRSKTTFPSLRPSATRGRSRQRCACRAGQPAGPFISMVRSDEGHEVCGWRPGVRHIKPDLGCAGPAPTGGAVRDSLSWSGAGCWRRIAPDEGSSAEVVGPVLALRSSTAEGIGDRLEATMSCGIETIHVWTNILGRGHRSGVADGGFNRPPERWNEV